MLQMPALCAAVLYSMAIFDLCEARIGRLSESGELCVIIEVR